MLSSIKIYTIGHGEQSLNTFSNILTSNGITTLVDVRANPVSIQHPLYSQDNLRESLDNVGIIYHWAGRQLGENHTPNPNSKHTALEATGLQGFADYISSTDFQKGVSHLINLAQAGPLAIMGADSNPDHCHRSMIADYLILQGVEVIHLLGTEKGKESDKRQDSQQHKTHQLNPMARRESIELVYDRNVTTIS